MSIVQWLLLFAAVVAVLLVYWRARRHRDDDPWKHNGNSEAAGKVLLPDYERLDPGSPGTPPVAATDGSMQPRTVIVDPGVQDEIAGISTHQEPAMDRAGAQSWESFSAKPDPQLGLNIEPEAGRATQRTVAAPPGQEKLIILHVAARDAQMFAGPAVHNALQLCRLQFGMREVYHRITEVNAVPEAVFSVASMVKPGYLDPVQAQGFKTPGLTLFMVIPGPIDAVTAFRDMLDTAQRLATRLSGDVLDDKRSQLTHQSEQFLHDEIAELQRRWRVQPRRK